MFCRFRQITLSIERVVGTLQSKFKSGRYCPIELIFFLNESLTVVLSRKNAKPMLGAPTKAVESFNNFRYI